jgi:hypothetical protein
LSAVEIYQQLPCWVSLCWQVYFADKRGDHYDLVNRHEIYVSQKTKEMFCLS